MVILCWDFFIIAANTAFRKIWMKLLDSPVSSNCFAFLGCICGHKRESLNWTSRPELKINKVLKWNHGHAVHAWSAQLLQHNPCLALWEVPQWSHTSCLTDISHTVWWTSVWCSRTMLSLLAATQSVTFPPQTTGINISNRLYHLWAYCIMYGLLGRPSKLPQMVESVWRCDGCDICAV